MNRDEDLEAALKSRPSDEREYGEPLAALAGSEALVRRVRPATRSRIRTGALPALAAIVVVLALGFGALAVGFLRPQPGRPDGSFDASQKTWMVGCFGQGRGFSPDALTSGQNHAETADTGAAAALRALLAAPAWGRGLPGSGWILVSQSDSTATFVAPTASAGPFVGGYVEVTVALGSPGPGGLGADGWRADSWGSCQLMAVPPAGYGPATWTLDPSVPFSPGASELHVLVTEWGCHGDDTAAGRISANVDYGEDAVVVTLATLSREGPRTCPGTPPTPYVVHLDQTVGSRSLEDGGVWPPQAMAAGGRPVVTPSPTPYPVNWHMPMDCTGEADGPGSFKAASMSAAFDVYCAALPAGWQRQSMSDSDQYATALTVSYSGPNGETLTLAEGDLCSKGQSACTPAGTSAGTAMFGDRQGQLFTGPPGAEYALYVDPGKSPSWKATGKGMSRETFKSLTAALIIVGK